MPHEQSVLALSKVLAKHRGEVDYSDVNWMDNARKILGDLRDDGFVLGLKPGRPTPTNVPTFTPMWAHPSDESAPLPDSAPF